MQFHELRPKRKSKKRKRVGRGGKRGTYSGRGIKGQKSRTGRRLKPAIRSFIKRYPKLRGYSFGRQKSKAVVVNLEVLDKKFQSGETVTPQILLERRLIPRIKGRAPEVKILGKGKLTKSLTIENCQISKQARVKVEKTHGVVK